jgi:hypothetical protein
VSQLLFRLPLAKKKKRADFEPGNYKKQGAVKWVNCRVFLGSVFKRVCRF